MAAYTFELSRCYEHVIRERQLACLARVDASLAAAVALGLGLAAPEPDAPPSATGASPALSMVGGAWPVDGRTVGILVGPDGAPGLARLLAALRMQRLLPLVIGPVPGLAGGVAAQRSYATATSAELDAVVIASPTPPGNDAWPTLDAKVGDAGESGTADARIVQLLQEAWRHAKPIVALPDASAVLSAAGVPAEGAGVVVAKPDSVLAELSPLLASHRVWGRFVPASR